MRVLVACEFSGTVRDAFARRGHDAWSCDLLPTERPGNHIQADVLEVVKENWDSMIAHPPCTHLATSGAVWFPRKVKEQREALEFFLALLNAPIPMICVENPVCVASSYIRPPTQIVHPWMFGDEHSKTTCLWLKNLPKLRPTKMVDRGEFHVTKSGKRIPKWYNLPPSPDRARLRSVTFAGIAEAMAEQWGKPHRTGFGLSVPTVMKGNK